MNAMRDRFIYSLMMVALFLIVGAVPMALHAEQMIGDADVSVNLNPEIPNAFQDVTMSLTSFATDLSAATISWTVNGKLALSGRGRTAYSFKTGAVGSTSTVDIQVSISGVPVINKKIIVAPLETNLLWEAPDTYVPPFYKGKAMPSSEASIKVVAMPNIRTLGGTKLKSGDFTYNWKRNYDADQDASGYGKDSYLFRTGFLNNSEKISVSLSSIKDSYTSVADISISTGAPTILFYEDSPTEGIRYENALADGFDLKNQVTAVIAEPYFFSPKDPKSADLKYAWTVNNQSIPVPVIKNHLPIQAGSQRGRAIIGLTIESASRLFESATKLINVSIGL